MKFKDLSKEILERCKIECQLQYTILDLEKECTAGSTNGGFTWSLTEKGNDFWNDVLAGRCYQLFFSRYPRKTIKTKNDFDIACYSTQDYSNYSAGKNNIFHYQLVDKLTKEIYNLEVKDGKLNWR